MSSSGARSRPSGKVVQTMRRWPLVSFFVLAYVVTWLLQTPLLIFGIPVFSGATHAPSLYVLPSIAIGVTGSAFLMTAVTQGSAGVRRLLQRLIWWRVGLQWFAVAVLLIPVSEVLVTGVVGSADALRAFTPGALLFYPAAYFAHFIFGPLFEEPGWRGFALPRLQHRFGPLRGTLLLGLLWSAWHFLLYVPTWLQDGLVGVLAGMVAFTLTTTSMTVIFTWLFNNTDASVLLAILLHASVDGTATYLQVLADNGVISSTAAATTTQLGLPIACVLWAVLLITFTRSRLSYQRYQGEAEQLDLHPEREPRRRGME
jgi:membrane protease YdiL (CAAX protease family)